jgi:hypothetical protein
MASKKTQIQKFPEAARDLETDNNEKRFNEKLGKIARQKPAPKARREKPDDDRCHRVSWSVLSFIRTGCLSAHQSLQHVHTGSLSENLSPILRLNRNKNLVSHIVGNLSDRFPGYLNVNSFGHCESSVDVPFGTQPVVSRQFHASIGSAKCTIRS